MSSTNCTFCEGVAKSGRPNAIPMTGLRFGRLVVEELACIAPRCWKCRCQCGRTTTVEGGNLRRKVNGTRSCGRCYCPAGVPRYKDFRKAKKEASNATTV
jgi:hypothetical protein